MNVIVAVDSEWGIGYKGDLLARVKEDLHNFARLTTGKTVILGSNTLATFPGGRVLKDRRNIVLNILLFVPFGFLLPLGIRFFRRFWVTYLTGLDSIQYLEDGRESPLKIFYVDAGDVDNMPLVGALYEQYHVPEEDQKSPMILWKGGYAMGRQAIREAMVPAIVNGEALGWPGWDQVPVS